MNGGVLTADLRKLRANYSLLASRASPSEAAAVVKANAYGIGAEAVVSALAEENCLAFYCFGVEISRRVREAARKSSFAFFSGPFSIEDCRLAEERQLIPVLNTLRQVELWRKRARETGRLLPFMAHVDTGMARFGFSPSDAVALRQTLANERMDSQLCGIISHLACADTPENPMNAEQLRRAQELRSIFPNVRLSLANSSGAFLPSSYRFDQIRAGIGLYGAHPHAGCGPNPLTPAVRFDAFLCQIRRTTEPTSVGYGSERVVPAGTILGCLPVGYADGLPRALAKSGSAYCMIGETPCHYVGRVSMDLTVVDATAVPEALLYEGAPVEIFGDRISAENFAAWCGTIPYEIFTGIGERVARRYLHASDAEQ